MKFFTTPEILTWLEEYIYDPQNHDNCLYRQTQDQYSHSPKDCNCPLGSAQKLITFLHHKLKEKESLNTERSSDE